MNEPTPPDIQANESWVVTLASAFAFMSLFTLPIVVWYLVRFVKHRF